jgi:hypothetical protein
VECTPVGWGGVGWVGGGAKPSPPHWLPPCLIMVDLSHHMFFKNIVCGFISSSIMDPFFFFACKLKSKFKDIFYV